MCNHCQTKPVFTLHSGEQLCKRCYLKYFEKKVRKTIRLHKLVNKDDKIGVAVSGGKDSLTVLELLHTIYKENQNITITAILIDEGIDGYRDKSRKTAEEFCKEREIPLHVLSYKDQFGFKLDNVVKGERPCSVCGVLRRNLLNKAARDLKLTKLATGHNLDDEAQCILMNQFRNNIEATARMGPVTGIQESIHFVRRIKPLYLVSEKEVMTFAYLKGIVDEFTECPYNTQSYRNQVREMLNSFEEKFPGTKQGLVKSFIEYLPELKEKYKKEGAKINLCACGEPTSKDKCQKCVVLENLKK
jgi:tRNA-5-methyluridine54 2-sulfurtransferase